MHVVFGLIPRPMNVATVAPKMGLPTTSAGLVKQGSARADPDTPAANTAALAALASMCLIRASPVAPWRPPPVTTLASEALSNFRARTKIVVDSTTHCFSLESAWR
jgi:hypothetical protein